jgi:hypothetical protein
MCGYPPATTEAADGSRTQSVLELNYARGGGGSGAVVADSGMTIVAAMMRSGNAPASSSTVAAIATKPLAQGAITKHAVAADSWSHEGSCGVPPGEMSSGISMPLMSFAVWPAIGLADAWVSSPGITHVVPSRASASWRANEKDNSRGTSRERLIP